jgi:hypothetical protein
MNGVADLAQALFSAPRHDPNADLSHTIPEQTGIYAWFSAQEDRIVYVGKATGTRGLYTRIMKQHLNTKYLLTNRLKWTDKDQFQAEHPAISNGKPAIDKSAFRKNVSRVHKLSPGHGSVDFIRAKFMVRFLPIAGEGTILALERELIATYRPEYNITSNETWCHVALR